MEVKEQEKDLNASEVNEETPPKEKKFLPIVLAVVLGAVIGAGIAFGMGLYIEGGIKTEIAGINTDIVAIKKRFIDAGKARIAIKEELSRSILLADKALLKTKIRADASYKMIWDHIFVYETPIWAHFKVGGEGFTSVQTGIGPILLALLDVKPYAGGFALYFDIGNITSGTLKDVKITLKYGTQQGKVKKTNKAIMKDIKPGSWRKVRVIISPASKEELDSIRAKLVIGSVFLRK